jgi:molybdopterin synthase catalytic subunit/molybdopterin converting factor small subunit
MLAGQLRVLYACFMRVRVLFFGMLKDMAGRSTDVVELAEGATLADLLAHYRGGIPRLQDYAGSLALSLNQEYAPASAVLHDNDEVALLPPVSGGADAASPAESRIGTRLVRERIDAERIVAAIKQPSDGAVCVFDGIVRDNSRGRRTLYLIYETYEAMAARQLETLAAEAEARFPIREVAIVHRLGRLEIGETSVLIAVAAAHRGPAFDACRWIIDTLKKTVPIWKKEHFADGAVWADGEPFPPEISPGTASPPDTGASH